ncbi:hypothetical protein PQX77_021995 [Marasmius sp. AFHP31]|nr:hypothetical protein PQX77_021995 [Marasmius sp. AFHP31]
MTFFIQLLSISVAIFASAVLALIIRSRKRSLSFLQGPPSPSFLLGHEWALTRVRRVGDLESDWFERYGPVFRSAGCFGEDILEVSDPRALQHICHKSAYRYKKPMDFEQLFGKLFGRGLVTVNGDIHQRQRKIMNPVFSAPQIRPFTPIFENCTQTLITKWRSEIEGGATIIDCYRDFHGMTLDALGESMFDYHFDAMGKTRAGGLRDILRDIFLDTRNPTRLKLLRDASYRFLPKVVIDFISLRKTREDKRWANWLAAGQKVTGALVTQKVENGGGQEKDKDILSVIGQSTSPIFLLTVSQSIFAARSLTAADPSKRLPQVEALSQMSTMTFAGHETTASTLNWVLYELSYNPEWQEKLFQEIQNIRGQAGNNDHLTVEDLESMPVLNGVIKETLRFHPIFPFLVREAETDDIIPLEIPITDTSGSALKEIPLIKGQRVNINVFEYNRLKPVWGEDAGVWNPERFLEGARPTTLGVFANLLTFSGGIRACIGWRFAVLELQVVTATLVEAFKFSAVEGIEIDQVAVGPVGPMVKGKWGAGKQLPLEVTLRNA